VKADDKLSNWVVRNFGSYRKQEMEEWTLVPTGSPMGQNETLGPHMITEQTNRRQEQEFRMALKRDDFAGLGKRQGKLYGCIG
jgi:hypothetical protein